MSDFVLAGGAALWLGVLTSISPCPLATNIAAVAFVGRHSGSARSTLLSAGLYTLGRAITYTVVAVAIVIGMTSAHRTSAVLQEYALQVVGPVIILIGMVILDLIRIPTFGSKILRRAREHVASKGTGGAILLGILLALSFCPVSAALFFGALIPLAASARSVVALPILYGIGSAVPVAVFALLVAFGSRSIDAVFQRVSGAERRLRMGTGVVLLVAGVYTTLTNVFGVVFFQ
jgi:cytochrome c-type biogenesis protein